MDTNQADTVEAVSIPTILTIVKNITTSDQCLQADTKLAEYINLIPHINFNSQEEKNSYSTDLFSIQEDVRSKFNIIKHEELRIENEKYKE
ncbi:hypothetical protein NPIL_41981, partial [Nephila pilipes]